MLSDKIGKRSFVLSPFLLCAALSMFSIKYFLAPENVFLYFLNIFCVGVFLGGI